MRRGRSEDAVIFVGSLFSSPRVLDSASRVLRRRFGDTFLESPSLPWDYTSYYCEELGSPLYRQFMFFERISDPASLVDVKLETDEIEKVFSTEGKRQINLDPGYLTLAKVVLASGKNYSHRIYLGRGVFCELELFYEKGRFRPLPYSYFDYRDQPYLKIFTDARTMLKRKLDGHPASSGRLYTVNEG